MSHKLLKFHAVTLLFSISSGIGATPAPQNAYLAENETLQQGATLTVTGEGFGNRSADSPVFIDYAEVTYENGEPNHFMGNLEDMTAISTVVDNPKAPWARAVNDPEKGPKDGYVARIQKSGDMRHTHSTAHYLMEGADATISGVKAYGGPDGWEDLPLGNPKLYLAWWIKAKYDPAGYYRATPLNKSGDFIEGERIQSDVGFSGRYINTDEDGLLNFEIVNFNGTGHLENEIIEGQQSGATTTFPDDVLRQGDKIGYESPGSQKYVRVWDEKSGTQGIRFSWTNMHQTITNRDKDKSIVNWNSTHLKADEWHLLELEMDAQAGTLETFINGNQISTIDFPKDTAATELGSPTIGLIGLDGKHGKFQETLIDEIYLDKKFNRVVIGNAKKFSDVTHYEIQNYNSWKNQQIRIKINLGSLDPNKDLYLYVADPEGNFNKQGLSLENLKEYPPKKTEMTVN